MHYHMMDEPYTRVNKDDIAQMILLSIYNEDQTALYS